MYIGHYAVSFALKKVDEKAPLGGLFLAVQLLDVAWSGLVIAGVEKVKFIPGFLPASPLNLYFMPFTHSLEGALAWSALAALLWLLAGRGPVWDRGKTALVMGLAVFSHWLLDLPVHGPDLGLLWDSHKVGLGLWHYPAATWLLEAALLGGGLLLAGKPTRSMALFVGILVTINTANIFMPQVYMPETVYALGALISYLLFAFVAHRLERRPMDCGRLTRTVGLH